MTVLRAEVDVAVVGGGSAGVAAAVAASEAGASVLLLERLGSCGGQAVSAYVGTVCGAWLRARTDLPAWACGGWPRRTAEALAKRTGARPQRTSEGLWYLPYTPFAMRRVMDEALDEAGVAPWQHATSHGAHRVGETVVLDVLAVDRPAQVRAAAVIDVTGTATVAHALGARPLPEEGGHQAPAYVLHVDGLPDGVGDAALKMALLRACMRGVQEGALPPDALALSLVPGSRRGTRAVFKLGLRGTMPDDPGAVSAAERRAREEAERILGWLAHDDPDLADLVIIETAAQVGFRSGRRVTTRHVCTAADLARLGPHEEGIARAAWPVERWGDDARPHLDLLPEGACWEVPAAALEVDGLDGVYVAGRTLGADEHALGSARVIGTCWQTGWAAGRLAAGYTRGASRDRTVTEIRAAMRLDEGSRT